ncbi:hypothetical protein DZK27_05425 [Rhodobacteraceae bacterium 63075]|nr:hypothetical protein DZK27_05425 [Rhodobacteraceae bacterium 63075]
MPFRRSIPCFSALLCLLAGPSLAQVTNFPDDVTIAGDLSVDDGTTGSLYVEDDSVIDGSLCLGNTCSPTETFANDETLKFVYVQHSIVFEDTSGPSSPGRDWTLRINDPNTVASGGIDRFSVEDDTAGTTPFTIAGGVPDNAFWLDSGTGNLGLGTSLPQGDLHAVSSSTAKIRLQETGSGADWEVSVGNDGIGLLDRWGSLAFPFFVENGAPSFALWVEDTGEVGLGTNNPEGILHTKADGVQLAYFESGDGGPVQVRFRTDSENRRFLAVNNANEVKSQLIFLDDRINFTGETDSGANLWLSVGPDGIVSQGPTCDPGPCDAVFNPEVFEVPDIEARAAQMWAQKHLPAIGPTKPGAPINLTEKMGGVIHELEVAHIYIEELHERLETQQAQMAAQSDLFRAMEARLKALEATR